MNILAVARQGRSGGAALVGDGKVLGCVEAPLAESRGGEGFPRDAAVECLAAGHVDAEQIDRIVVCGNLRPVPRYRPEPGRGGYAGRDWTGGTRGSLARVDAALRRRPLYRRGALESLAAATFLGSPLRSAATILFAGEGADSGVYAFRGQGSRVGLVQSLPGPHSPAFLLDVFGHFLRLTPGRFAYELAYLGAYGAPRYSRPLLEALAELRPDGSFLLKAAGAGSAASPTSAADWLEQTQAVPRPSAGQVDRLAADVARSMGAVLRFLLSHVIVHTMRSMGVERVCLGGDFAFEMARHRLLPEDPLFERAWVHPQRGAAALALGAALADWFDTEAEPGAPHPDVGYPYLGAAHSNLSLEDFLEESGIPAEDLPADMIPSRGAELLLHRNRVGWFQDREESGIGPAGHRNRLSMLGREALDSLTDPLESGAVPEPLTLFVLGDEADRYFDPEATPPFGSAPVAGPVLSFWNEAGRSEETPQPGTPRRIRAPLTGRGPAMVLRVTPRRLPGIHRLLSALQRRSGLPMVRAEPLAERQGRSARSPAAVYGLLGLRELEALAMGTFILYQSDDLPPLASPAARDPAAAVRWLTAVRWGLPLERIGDALAKGAAPLGNIAARLAAWRRSRESFWVAARGWHGAGASHKLPPPPGED